MNNVSEQEFTKREHCTSTQPEYPIVVDFQNVHGPLFAAIQLFHQQNGKKKSEYKRGQTD
jgi:hypothetical protein